jgi:hypothetical protein
MTETKFKSELRRAEMLREHSDCGDYWSGYIRGLRRGHHGESFGTTEEHEMFLSLADRKDERSRELGRGYRDGLLCSDTHRGRPIIEKVCKHQFLVFDKEVKCVRCYEVFERVS